MGVTRACLRVISNIEVGCTRSTIRSHPERTRCHCNPTRGLQALDELPPRP
ncbi:Uncharacterised protein [Bordetella pertussis]|nr:Uncharacterised protein [Bordetella pertussis]